MKKIKLIILILAAQLTVSASQAFSDNNVTGLWTGTTTVSNGGGVYQNIVTYIQNGSTVVGSTPPSSNGGCSYAGSVTGNQIMLHAECPQINYSSDSTATINATFDFMEGTFFDSQGTTGTFNQTKQKNTLAPGNLLNEAPLVVVNLKSATVTLLKFDSVQPKQGTAARKAAGGGKEPKISYELTLKGAEKRKITSKKNIITLKNLKPGNYTATYRVLAVKDGKTVQASKKSPTAAFTIN